MIIRISAHVEGDGGAPEELLILELQGNVLPTKPASLADSERTAASGRTAAAGVVDPTASLDGLLIGHLSMRPVRCMRARACVRWQESSAGSHLLTAIGHTAHCRDRGRAGIAA